MPGVTSKLMSQVPAAAACVDAVNATNASEPDITAADKTAETKIFLFIMIVSLDKVNGLNILNLTI